eukprot:TRINITY_DN1410_c0_g1_i5.p1 TRINITY_DN1410_c0_g1~~TRINITY_DN1410_c0_g1_i5.p1  ORF type:complete len:164 (+),score=1.11 TRINITY_DN1410_c0_g1_i5:523-1014(+)
MVGRFLDTRCLSCGIRRLKFSCIMCSSRCIASWSAGRFSAWRYSSGASSAAHASMVSTIAISAFSNSLAVQNGFDFELFCFIGVVGVEALLVLVGDLVRVSGRSALPVWWGVGASLHLLSRWALHGGPQAYTFSPHTGRSCRNSWDAPWSPVCCSYAGARPPR